jgi:hemerythrin superfamily protein
MDNDPIEIIKNDHRQVEELFKSYEKLGEQDTEQQRTVADEIIDALTAHTQMEETYCYPRFKEAFAESDDALVEEALVEHEGAKKIITELKIQEAGTPQFTAHMKVLMEEIAHHVKEEEDTLLPKAEKEIPEAERAAMGDAMAEFKRTREVIAE